MMEQLARKAGDSVWRKVGEKAVITAVTTLLSEAIKASVELVKMAKLREQKAEFDDRRARDKKREEPDDTKNSEPDEGEEVDEVDEDAKEETDAAETDESEKPGGGGPKVDFATYVTSKQS